MRLFRSLTAIRDFSADILLVCLLGHAGQQHLTGRRREISSQADFFSAVDDQAILPELL